MDKKETGTPDTIYLTWSNLFRLLLKYKKFYSHYHDDEFEEASEQPTYLRFQNTEWKKSHAPNEECGMYSVYLVYVIITENNLV